MHSRRNIKIENKLFRLVLHQVLLACLLLISSTKILATEELSSSISVSASIGDNRITLFGFTSPLSRVELTSPKTFALTYSDNKGYYIFDRTILPKHPGELCITATDDSLRRTSPICIPEPPPINFHTDIGPVILPPSLTITDETIKPDSTTVASGQSTPDSQINIFIYQVNHNPPLFPKPAQAFGLPLLSTRSDANGNFSFNLPTAYSSKYRLFATLKFDNQDSPKSNTLTYALPSVYWILWLQNKWLITLLPLFLISLIIFFYILYLYTKKDRTKEYYSNRLETSSH